MKRLVLLALVAISLVIASTVAAAGPGNGNGNGGRPDGDPPGHAMRDEKRPDHAGGPGGRHDDGTDDEDDGDDGTDEDAIRFNDIQARGTHNSTHLDPKGVVTDGAPFGWGYSHRTLTAQLEEQGVRQVELDVHYNWAKDDFDVYHVWFGDDRVTCDTLTGCLAEMRAWSDDHPGSAPLMALIEPKDGGAPYSFADGSTDPEAHLPEDGDPFTRPFDAHAYQRLDEVLLESFGGSVADGGRVLTPDDVTAPGMDLRTSITTVGWPAINDLRQHIVFVVDGGDHADPYSAGYTSLAGRAMFVQADDQSPVAAFVGRDGTRLPGETKYGRMARLVSQGFMIRDLTSPDEFEQALAAGAHFLSTDFPEQLDFGDAGAPMRCNPVVIAATGRTCTARAIESHDPHGYPVPPDPSDEYDQVIADKVDRLVIASAESVAALAG